MKEATLVQLNEVLPKVSLVRTVVVVVVGIEYYYNRLACTCRNSLFSKPVAPPPPLKPTTGGSLLSMLKTQNTLINMKEVTN